MPAKLMIPDAVKNQLAGKREQLVSKATKSKASTRKTTKKKSSSRAVTRGSDGTGYNWRREDVLTRTPVTDTLVHKYIGNPPASPLQGTPAPGGGGPVVRSGARSLATTAAEVYAGNKLLNVGAKGAKALVKKLASRAGAKVLARQAVKMTPLGRAGSVLYGGAKLLKAARSGEKLTAAKAIEALIL